MCVWVDACFDAQTVSGGRRSASPEAYVHELTESKHRTERCGEMQWCRSFRLVEAGHMPRGTAAMVNRDSAQSRLREKPTRCPYATQKSTTLRTGVHSSPPATRTAHMGSVTSKTATKAPKPLTEQAGSCPSNRKMRGSDASVHTPLSAHHRIEKNKSACAVYRRYLSRAIH